MPGINLALAAPTKAIKGEMRIIGGVIGYEEYPELTTRAESTIWEEHSSLFFVNARSALKWLVEQLEPRTTWLPSYLCPDILKAFSGGSTQLRIFPIGKNLLCDDLAWCRELQNGDAVLIIHYFGISWDRNVAMECKRRGAILIKDSSQALYSGLRRFWNDELTDYCIFSPRKLIGVSDGGILVALKGNLCHPQLCAPPGDWIAKADAACGGRRAFEQGSKNRSWFDTYQEAEAEAPVGPYAMSEKSRQILDRVDYLAQSMKRRQNYNSLLSKLRDYAVVRGLDELDVPLGFPVRVRRRDDVRKKLFDNDVFPPIHWDLDKSVPEEFQAARSLSREILTLPCDHRYGIEEMERVADVFTAAASIVTLRPLAMDDLERVHEWHNSRELYEHLVGDFFGPTLEQVRQWLQSEIQPRPSQVVLAICAGNEHEHIGNLYLRNIDQEKHDAELHIFIGDPQHREKGLGTMAMQTALQHARTSLGLKRIYLHVLSDNARAIHVYERLGFKCEKKLTGHARKEDDAKDVLLMSIDLGQAAI